jgi:hypothetical protein
VHPTQHQKAIVRNFTFQADGTVSAPTVEVIAPETPQPTIHLDDFFEQVFDSIISVFELMVVHICEKHVVAFGAFEPHVVEKKHQAKELMHVRFGYDLFRSPTGARTV